MQLLHSGLQKKDGKALPPKEAAEPGAPGYRFF